MTAHPGQLTYRGEPRPREPQPTAGGRSRAGRAVAGLRTHWAAAVLLAAGAVLRGLALAAYHPALLYPDTLKYLAGAWPGADPMGYAVILRVILAGGNLGTVVLVQHLAGLAIGLMIYLVVLRAAGSRVLAAVAMAPVLLDAYQVQIEQMVMPDVWFEALAVAGLAALAWTTAPSWRRLAAAGLLLGASAIVRQIGEALLLPALVYLIVLAGGWRRVARSTVALCAAFALPVLAYCGIAYLRTGQFRLSDQGSIAGRAAAAADCATLRLPVDLRPFCPSARQQRYGPDWLTHSSRSPLKRAPVPPGRTRGALISAFDSAVEHQQPGRIIGAVLRDSLLVFAPVKTGVPGTTPIARWQFQVRFPRFRPEISTGPGGAIELGVQRSAAAPFRHLALPAGDGGPARVDHQVAALLRRYQLAGGYTPGPVLALFTLAGLAGALIAVLGPVLTWAGTRRARRGRGADPPGGPPADRVAGTGTGVLPAAAVSLLFLLAGGAVLLVSDLFEYSWRYQLPALITLPVAGAAGARALWLAVAPGRARRWPFSARPPTAGSSRSAP